MTQQSSAPPDVASAQDLVADARGRIENLTAEELAGELERGGTVLVDLREEVERELHGAIPGAVHIPRGVLEFCADPALPVHADPLEPSRRVILYCAVGNRSALAALSLEAMGFRDVAHLDGGFASWRVAGGPVETPPPITADSAPGWWAVLCSTVAEPPALGQLRAE